MSHRLINPVMKMLAAAVLVSALGCARPSQPLVPSPVEGEVTLEPAGPVQSPTPPIERASDTPAPVRALTLTPTPSTTRVTITAVDGDLAIRTGPDIVFVAIARLEQGETVQALARSVLEGWLQIPIPSQPGKTGWVSIQTRFSEVDGRVLDLPKIMAVEWPFGSYLRNCTGHTLIVEPGGKTLPPLSQAPANRVWFFPGLYHIYDLDLAGRPEVTGIQLREHVEVDIIEDGENRRGVCP